MVAAAEEEEAVTPLPHRAVTINTFAKCAGATSNRVRGLFFKTPEPLRPRACGALGPSKHSVLYRSDELVTWWDRQFWKVKLKGTSQ